MVAFTFKESSGIRTVPDVDAIEVKGEGASCDEALLRGAFGDGRIVTRELDGRVVVGLERLRPQESPNQAIGYVTHSAYEIGTRA